MGGGGWVGVGCFGCFRFWVRRSVWGGGLV